MFGYVQVNTMTLTYCAYECSNHSTKSFYKGLKLLTEEKIVWCRRPFTKRGGYSRNADVGRAF